MDVDDVWARRAVRRRWRRRAPAAVVLVGVAVLVVVSEPRPRPLLAVASLIALLAVAGAGWWWFERGAGESPRRLWRAARDGSAAAATRAEDLDEVRAEYAVRHHLPVPAGSQHRVDRLLAERRKQARQGPWLAAASLGLAVLWWAGDAPAGLVVTWAVCAVVWSARSVHDRRIVTRWRQAPAAGVPVVS